VLLAGCASEPPKPTKFVRGDGGIDEDVTDDRIVSDPRHGDPHHGDPHHGDPHHGDPGGCTLGSLQHCGTCANACDGTDDVGTTRICTTPTSSGVCDIVCKGEYYDMDSDIDTGCEALDMPVQDSAANAVAITLPGYTGGDGSTPCDGATAPCTVVGYIYSDNRNHASPPTTRKYGRDDWYKVNVSGTAGPNGNFGACLWIGSFPADDRFSLCVSDAGSTDPSSSCNTVSGGGNSVCLNPLTAADTGTFYVRIRKTAGSNTLLGYALYLEH